MALWLCGVLEAIPWADFCAPLRPGNVGRKCFDAIDGDSDVIGFSLTAAMRSVLWVIYSDCVTPHIIGYVVVQVSVISEVMDAEGQLERGLIVAPLVALCSALSR